MSNVRLPIGPLRWIFGGPELHHWHHERVRETGNYANISPLMDILFGTYRCPDHEPPVLGVEKPSLAAISGNFSGRSKGGAASSVSHDEPRTAVPFLSVSLPISQRHRHCSPRTAAMK